MSDHAKLPPAHDPEKLPRHTTPTWEVELLISGVTVFAMLQLPGWLDQWMWTLLPRFDHGLRMPLQTLFIYMMSASVILAVTFSLHLLLRAHWIARVGMHSVYPDGVRWDKLRSGPILREVEQGLVGDPLAAIERADNRATRVFAIGVSMASVLLVLVVAIVLLFPPLYLASRLLGLHIAGDVLFMTLIGVLMLPWVAMLWVDRLFGARLAPDGRLRRAMTAMFRGYAFVGFGRGVSATGLLGSHHGEKRIHVIMSLAMVVCMTIAVAGFMVKHNIDHIGSYSLFPQLTRADPQQLESAHYDDQRDPLRDLPLPFIPSAVVTGDYLRLVVPYRPQQDKSAQRRHCPDALAIKDDATRAGALLRCLGELHAVTLDGRPLANLHYAAGSDPRTERPALVAMIDIRALPAGRHVLHVAQPTDAESALDFAPVVVIGDQTRSTLGKAIDGTRGKDGGGDSIPFWH